MINRKMVWKTFKQEGVLDSKDKKVKELVSYVKDNPTKCWADLIPVYREKYYETFDAVVPVLLKMRDPTINMVLVKNLDPKQSNELKALQDMADKTDPAKDPVTIKQLAKLGENVVNKKLQRKSLPGSLKSYLTVTSEASIKKKASKKKPTINK